MVSGIPRALLDNLIFAEGPRWHAGRLWFSDMHAHEVVAVDPGGRRETIATLAALPSGLGFLPDGLPLVVTMEDRKLLRLEPSGPAVHADLSALAAHCNDMVVDGGGRAYVGDMAYDAGAGGEFRPGSVILVTPDGQARVAAEDFAIPNGSVITPDGRTLIVAESRGGRLTAFTIAADGTLQDRRVWAPLDGTPDGICLDAEGCVWVASPRPPSAFLRVAEGGVVRDRLDVSGYRAIACMLGGPARKTLFLLEAISGRAQEIKGRGNARIRAVEVDVAGAGWP
jgi:sugar lactone lactonase YvrE